MALAALRPSEKQMISDGLKPHQNPVAAALPGHTSAHPALRPHRCSELATAFARKRILLNNLMNGLPCM
ncbi:hypothetical protein [Neisseria sp. CCUG12390]|uniref:hypothetical protein n=1 Tax=Neisseria sp. CCUG12390 TaxID=3392035 RepID=UPI003A0FFE5F